MAGTGIEVGLLEHLKKRTYGIFLTGQIALYGMCCWQHIILQNTIICETLAEHTLISHRQSEIWGPGCGHDITFLQLLTN